jgi:hypothetical protein
VVNETHTNSYTGPRLNYIYNEISIIVSVISHGFKQNEISQKQTRGTNFAKEVTFQF